MSIYRKPFSFGGGSESIKEVLSHDTVCFIRPLGLSLQALYPTDVLNIKTYTKDTSISAIHQ
jgi:hypothetical protein